MATSEGHTSIQDSTKRPIEESEVLIPSWRRWPITILFALYSATNAFQWLQFVSSG